MFNLRNCNALDPFSTSNRVYELDCLLCVLIVLGHKVWFNVRAWPPIEWFLLATDLLDHPSRNPFQKSILLGIQVLHASHFIPSLKETCGKNKNNKTNKPSFHNSCKYSELVCVVLRILIPWYKGNRGFLQVTEVGSVWRNKLGNGSIGHEEMDLLSECKNDKCLSGSNMSVSFAPAVYFGLARSKRRSPCTLPCTWRIQCDFFIYKSSLLNCLYFSTPLSPHLIHHHWRQTETRP